MGHCRCSPVARWRICTFFFSQEMCKKKTKKQTAYGGSPARHKRWLQKSKLWFELNRIGSSKENKWIKARRVLWVDSKWFPERTAVCEGFWPRSQWLLLAESPDIDRSCASVCSICPAKICHHRGPPANAIAQPLWETGPSGVSKLLSAHVAASSLLLAVAITSPADTPPWWVIYLFLHSGLYRLAL